LQQAVNENNKVIAYSMGNFLFPMHWQVAMDSAVFWLRFSIDKGVKSVTMDAYPVSLTSHRPVDVSEAPGQHAEIVRERVGYIISQGYQYGNERRWPVKGPWSR
jgi:poly-gamma-glutamate capsule biosynthesis protein CapA/YwtB (metallophosphatase superfamily)